MIDGIQPRRRSGGFAGGQTNTTPQQTQTPPAEPAFRPPEAFADIDMNEPAEAPAPDSLQPPKNGRKFSLRFKLTKKRIIILVVAAVLLLGGGGAAAYKLLQKKPVPKPAPVAKTETKVEPPKPTTVASPLTGVQVKPELTQLPVTGVMIENSPDARPQSGLKEAGIVYEAIAEGGITRFLALFQEAKPGNVGPIRSARPYYLEWLQGYDAAIAHVGGSPEALALIKSANIKDLDQFSNGGSYHRVSTRYAPHNVYTSLDDLISLSQKKGFTKSTFTGFARKVPAASATPSAKTINLTLSGYLYNVHYDFDAATNTYKRSEGGKPHMDAESNTQLNPNVVVAMVVPYGIKSDGLHSDYQTTGSGKAFIFQDGIVMAGTWEKRSSKDPIRFGDANGAPIGLNPGQTWVTAVGLEGSVAYAP